MMSRRLTALLRPSGPGINSKGLPTINVSGTEIALETYFRILDLANGGRDPDEIVADITSRMDAEDRGSCSNYSLIVGVVLTNYKLAHGSHTTPSTPSVRHRTVTNQSKPRMSTMLSPRRVATHANHSDPNLKSSVLSDDGEEEEERLVIDALKLTVERDAINEAISDGMAKRRATAAMNFQVQPSLRQHQAVDDNAETVRSLYMQNLS